MEKEKIERTAKEYAKDKYGGGNAKQWAIAQIHAGRDGFIDGARWRIDEAWHNEKEMPDKEELVLCEICRNGEKAYLPLEWKADGKMTVDIPFLTDWKVTRWAYITDLLPDGK